MDNNSSNRKAERLLNIFMAILAIISFIVLVIADLSRLESTAVLTVYILTATPTVCRWYCSAFGQGKKD